jgi:hypothetical protein
MRKGNSGTRAAQCGCALSCCVAQHKWKPKPCSPSTVSGCPAGRDMGLMVGGTGSPLDKTRFARRSVQCPCKAPDKEGGVRAAQAARAPLP